MPAKVCDVCGSSDIKEIKCKVICQNCGTILQELLLDLADCRLTRTFN